MGSSANPVLDVENLVVDYGKGKKASRAVRGISFKVWPGECVGFIGANGAGKSTTMKAIMGFIFPKSGSVKVFGAPAGTVESRRRLGYLPEVAMYYPFMKARELLELYGGLQGLSSADLKSRIPEILDEVGLSGKGNVLLKNFSKGMQQRLGIAQAIIADPDFLIFDELSSGLDPLGRHDLRGVLLKLREKKRTIFFSSHELSEVESLCDRVIMIDQGELVAEASVQDLMKPLNIYELVCEIPESISPNEIFQNVRAERDGNTWTAEFTDVDKYSHALQALSAASGKVLHTGSRNKSLEDYFIELVQRRRGGATPGTVGMRR